MKVLNLYAGIGGNRKLWENVDVTAIENNEQIANIYKQFFPNDIVIISDAHKYLLEHFSEFDFIWSSPPCQSHSGCNHFLKGQGIFRYPDMKLWQEIIFLKHFFKGLYCVENVKSYYEPIIEPQIIGRHYFWANFLITRRKIDYVQIGTMNRQASEISQRKAIIREAQIPELLELHELQDFKLKNKRQVLRNCVLPEVGLHVLNCSQKKYHYNQQTQQTLF
jgi:DNA (cytosine-5)-methyltransferase 1